MKNREECWQWKGNGLWSERHKCSCQHDDNKHAIFSTTVSFFLESFRTPQDERNPARTKSPRGPQSVWENVSVAVQGTWVAFPRVSVLEDQTEKQILGKVLICTRPGWQTVQRRSKKEWWKKRCGFIEGEILIDFTNENHTCWSQSDVFNSSQPYCVTPTFRTKINGLDQFVEGILISATTTLQNLIIGPRKRRKDKSDMLAKQRENWPKNMLKF